VLALSNTLVEELLAADTIVMGAPIHNFAISALLKGWIDQVVRVGRTVLFNLKGPQGLLTGKKAVVITSRGGSYRASTPTAQYDQQEPYLRHILAFVGLTDATFIHAETQKTGELGESSWAAAIAQIQQAAVEQTAAAALQ
jgi:FMN-dependent NADH-azoreductase